MKEKYRNHPNILFLGKKSNVAEYLSAADVFVSSSESEGMPNAVLEAVACKLPVYLSDIPQHLEVFQSVPGCGKAYVLGNREMLSKLFQGTTYNDIQTMQRCGEKISNSDLTMTEMGKKYAAFYANLCE